MPLPRTVAENQDVRSSLALVLRPEQSSQDWADAEHREDRCGDFPSRPSGLVTAPVGQREPDVADAIEGTGAFGECLRLRGGQAERLLVRSTGPRFGGDQQPHLTLRKFVRQRLKENAVDDAEDRCVRANPERQCQDDDGTETRIASQRAHAVRNIAR